MVMVPKWELEELAKEVAALRGRVEILEGRTQLELVPAGDVVTELHSGFRARARELEARQKV